MRNFFRQYLIPIVSLNIPAGHAAETPCKRATRRVAPTPASYPLHPTPYTLLSAPLHPAPYFGLRSLICTISGGDPRRMGGPPVPTPRLTYR